jgi:protoporphyrinogen IX oxidase
MFSSILIALHVFANLLWIGSILVVAWMLQTGTDPLEARLAAKLYRTFSAPAFGVSFLSAVVVLVMHPSDYMKAHWFHGKLTLALVVIALHHVIGARAKKVANGSMQTGAPSGILGGALGFCALGVVALAILKGALVH